MAIPRDIEEGVECDVRIYRIDDLQEISKNNHALRQEQALRAQEMAAQKRRRVPITADRRYRGEIW